MDDLIPKLCCIPSPAGLPAGPYRARLHRAGMQEQRSSVGKHSAGISGESQTRQARAVYAVNLTSAQEAPASSFTSHPLTPFSTSLHHTGPAHMYNIYGIIPHCSIGSTQTPNSFWHSKWSKFTSGRLFFHA